MAKSFLQSAIRGAGSELGRSSMRMVLNPVFKGKDARPVGIYNSNNSSGSLLPKNSELINDNTIKIGKERNLAIEIVSLNLNYSAR